ncbi:MAG: ACT domain-containing protein [Alphaproteobacteria bacterium]
MNKTLVLTFIAADKPGLVEKLTDAVAQNGGNWLESRMANLAEKFAGIAMVEVPEDQAPALRKALSALEAEGFHLTIEDAAAPAPGPSGKAASSAAARQGHLFNLDLVGPDQPGILRDITHCLAKRGVSVEEMETDIREAPMSGGLMFYAQARILVPPSLTRADLQQSLESLAGSLMVDITLRRES